MNPNQRNYSRERMSNYGGGGGGGSNNPMRDSSRGNSKTANSGIKTKIALIVAILALIAAIATFIPYTVVTKQDADFATKQRTNAATFTKQPEASYTVMEGDTLKISVAATKPQGSTGTLSYQWYSATDEKGSKGVMILGAMKDEFKVPTYAAGRYYYYAEAIVSHDDGQNYTAKSNVTIITVTAYVNRAPKITKQPTQTTTVAQNESDTQKKTLSVEVSFEVQGTIRYEWHKNFTADTNLSSAIVGGNSSQFEFAATEVGQCYYFVVVYNNVDGNDYAVVSNVATVNVKRDFQNAPMILKQPDPLVFVEKGKELSLSVEAELPRGSVYTVSDLRYQWKIKAKDESDSKALFGENEKTININTNTIGNFEYSVTISINGTNYTTDSDISNVIIELVAPSPTLEQQPKGTKTEYTVGEKISLSVKVAENAGNLSYKWYSNFDSKQKNGVLIEDENASIIDLYLKQAGQYYFYVVVTSSFSEGGRSSGVESRIVKITVLEDKATAVRNVVKNVGIWGSAGFAVLSVIAFAVYFVVKKSANTIV